MANPIPKIPRRQHSVWLMLGGAMVVSVFGWASIVRQTEGPRQPETPPLELVIVELPAPQSANRGVSAQAPANTNREATSAPLRQVTRAVLLTRSSN
jgi:hypothetical protein